MIDLIENGSKPAYPTGQNQSGIGLTKREYFAALALQGMLSNPSNSNLDIYGVNTSGPLGFIATTNVVRDAINYADELLKQLKS